MEAFPGPLAGLPRYLLAVSSAFFIHFIFIVDKCVATFIVRSMYVHGVEFVPQTCCWLETKSIALLALQPERWLPSMNSLLSMGSRNIATPSHRVTALPHDGQPTLQIFGALGGPVWLHSGPTLNPSRVSGEIASQW